jgi:16S rRNA (adenine1518-N6/adenine1519-N6)-dimethyltransferase
MDIDDAYLFKIIRGAFQQRRKTLVNTLSHQTELELSKENIRQVLDELGISQKIRGEALNLDQFVELTNKL